MAKELGRMTVEQPVCAYLRDRPSQTEHRVLMDVSPTEYHAMLERGWRRFGPEYFRPACSGCVQCVSLRVPVATFQPTRSQRRALSKCNDVELLIGDPEMDHERIDLYHKWHENRESARGWAQNRLSYEQFFLQFCFPHPCVREFSYYLQGRLIAVGIVDETPFALSSVYFYFDPDCERMSLGVFSALAEIETARGRGLTHVYLGYRVQGCPSVEYKAQYRPHELLVGRPGPEEKPRWVPEYSFCES